MSISRTENNESQKSHSICIDGVFLRTRLAGRGPDGCTSVEGKGALRFLSRSVRTLGRFAGASASGCVWPSFRATHRA